MWNWLHSSKKTTDSTVPEPVPTQEPAVTGTPKVIIMTGSSGSGRKSTARRLSEELGVPYIPSYTTRPPRPNEQNGVHYHFLTEAEFRTMEENGEFIQTVRLERGHYGLPKSALERALADHPAAVVVVNREGAQALRDIYGRDAVRIFLYVTKDDVRLRLERESAPPEVVEEYMRNYTDQVIHKKESDFLLQNMEQTATVGKIKDYLKERMVCLKN